MQNVPTPEEERRLVKEGIAEYRAGRYALWDAGEVKQFGRKLLRERLEQEQTNSKNDNNDNG